MAKKTTLDPERTRLQEDGARKHRWKKWGPYLSERQWGTVREDYSAHGTAWDYFPHDHARSRAYRWGEDGLAGLSDDRQQICVAVALWNERDPILKERLFGLTNSEGNHGEDVKELYYYLDATPTHSYLKMLYKYPQREFPYAELVSRNAARGKQDPEFELLDTDVFDDDRYFDVVVEYAKAGPDDILMRVEAFNRGSEAAPLHVLPQVWFRNTWSWNGENERPTLERAGEREIVLQHSELGEHRFFVDGNAQLLFAENDTNNARLHGADEAGPFKDAFHDHVVGQDGDAVNAASGTKAAAHVRAEVPAGESVVIRARLAAGTKSRPFAGFDGAVTKRRQEADRFYEVLQQGLDDADARRVQRQAFAGMIWGKQFYCYDVPRWLEGDPAQPPPPEGRERGRNRQWSHLNNADILSMPDTWEYPWYAAWDLAFHCIPLALIDSDFAKEQLVLLTRDRYLHPNGQMPAYEWAFGDVNPPVHAWAAWRVYKIDEKQNGRADLAFLERVYHKLLLNFTWWVNRKDDEGLNIFQGGFLGLDNIGVFDRSAELPTGGHLHQADGTSWMAMYSLNLMRIALELAQHNPVYEDIASKFFEHFLHIAKAMTNMGGKEMGLWCDEDEFYYDVLHLPGDEVIWMKLRSLVGLIPLFAVEVLEPEVLEKVPGFRKRLEEILETKPELAALVSRWHEPGRGERRLLSLVRGHRMKRVLKRMLDETEFLSEFGVRSLSRRYKDQPYVFNCCGTPTSVDYQPAESSTGLFGGNSNWRGPIWFPVNYLIIESLQRFHHYYGDDFRVECPTGSGDFKTLGGAADEIAKRLASIFLRNESEQRPVFRAHEKHARDPHFRDHLLFYEYFDGDTGRGVGASHQTGWTGLIAKLLQPRR